MRSVLFIILPFYGHYLGIRPLALFLKDRGLSVSILSYKGLQSVIGADSLHVIEFPFDHISSDFQPGSSLIFRWIKRVWLVITGENRLRFDLFVKELEKTINKVDPDAILIDAFLPQLYLLAGKHCPDRRYVINTMLSTGQSENIPPLDRFFIPSEGIWSKMITRFLWKWNHLKKIIGFFKLRFLLVGQDYFSLCLHGAKSYSKNGVAIDNGRSFHVAVSGSVELVAPPLALDFPWLKKSENLVHINFLDWGRNKTLESNYEQLIHKAVNSGRKLIACSFGTLSKSHNSSCYHFFEKLFDVLGEQKGWHLILSCGPFMRKFNRNEIPENVSIFEKIPQYELLGHTELLITHGGINSIVEAMMQAVPLLVYPLNRKWDQPGNAARVVYHKVGLAGSLSEAPEKIHRKISTILNTPAFVDAARGMQQRLQRETQMRMNPELERLFGLDSDIADLRKDPINVAEPR